MKRETAALRRGLKRGRYLSLHGEAVAPDSDMNSDFRIDPGRFGVMLADIV